MDADGFGAGAELHEEILFRGVPVADLIRTQFQIARQAGEAVRVGHAISDGADHAQVD